MTIERTFEELLKFFEELEEEESRAVREGLDEESLAIFDLLKKPNLDKADIQRIKKVAKELLRTLKAEKLRVDQWREKEATQSAVKVAIHDFLIRGPDGPARRRLLGGGGRGHVRYRVRARLPRLPDRAVAVLRGRDGGLTPRGILSGSESGPQTRSESGP